MMEHWAERVDHLEMDERSTTPEVYLIYWFDAAVKYTKSNNTCRNFSDPPPPIHTSNANMYIYRIVTYKPY